MKPFRSRGEAIGYQSERLRCSPSQLLTAPYRLPLMLISLNSKVAGIYTQAIHAIEQGAARQP